MQAAIKHYGSWSQAVDAAEIDYSLHLRIWSTKAWVRKLRSPDVTKIRRRVHMLVKE